MIRSLVCLLLTTLVLSCAVTEEASMGSTTIGNPMTRTTQVRIAAVPEGLKLPTTSRTLGDGTTLTGAWLSVERVALEAAPSLGCSSGTQSLAELEARGPFLVDLLTGQAIPEIPAIDLDYAYFCDFRVKFAKSSLLQMEDGETLSVLIEGTTPAKTPLRIALDFNDDIRLKATSSGYELAFNEGHRLFVLFDLDSVLANLDLDTRPTTDGTLLIDDDNNADVADLIEDRIEDHIRLVRDIGTDGLITDLELSESNRLAGN